MRSGLQNRIQEGIYGYLFTLPVIVGVLVFTIIPIFRTFYFSVTNYNPLETQKNLMTVNIQDELLLNRELDPASISDVVSTAANFDMVSFLADDLLLELTDNQKNLIATYFDKTAFFSDLVKGKLNENRELQALIAQYMGSHSKDLFPPYKPLFTGVKNFTRMIGDQYFWISLWNAVQFALVVVTLQTILAILLAVAANSLTGGIQIFKIIYFIPSITSSSAISMIFLMIYFKTGLLNQLLGTFGFEPVDWLNNPATALPAVMAMNIWTTAGYFMITFLAGLKGIPAELYESADIEGAPASTVFWKITVPLLRPQVLYVIVMGTIGCLQVFDQIYYLIPNLRNRTIAYYIYHVGFKYGEMGYASAIAVVLFAIILGITMVQRRFIRESLV
uniref:Sugar ABC transporter permease n=1 Tax=Gracilinema caldarium TaxID=215591 RepID=A0A7C3II66_9SPIR